MLNKKTKLKNFNNKDDRSGFELLSKDLFVIYDIPSYINLFLIKDGDPVKVFSMTINKDSNAVYYEYATEYREVMIKDSQGGFVSLWLDSYADFQAYCKELLEREGIVEDKEISGNVVFIDIKDIENQM